MDTCTHKHTRREHLWHLSLQDTNIILMLFCPEMSRKWKVSLWDLIELQMPEGVEENQAGPRSESVHDLISGVHRKCTHHHLTFKGPFYLMKYTSRVLCPHCWKPAVISEATLNFMAHLFNLNITDYVRFRTSLQHVKRKTINDPFSLFKWMFFWLYIGFKVFFFTVVTICIISQNYLLLIII